MRCAVLDLGSNSFHVLVADLDGHRLVPVRREREMLHLGAEVARHGQVPAAAHQRAVDTVAHLAALARRAGAGSLQAVATSALRDAGNGPEVLTDLRAAAGTDIRVLDGDEEARLAYLGVRSAVALQGEPVLVLDLGGGSLELAVGVAERVQLTRSVRLGASRLSARVSTDPISAAELADLEAHIDAELDTVVEAVQAQVPAATVAVGGTVRALARMAAAARGIWLPSTLNMLDIATDELAALRDKLVGGDLAARLALPGMKDRRADHLHIAAIVVVRTLQRLGIASVTVSDWGLREGLLLTAEGATTPRGPHVLRLDEIERLRTTFVPADPHPVHVAQLAGQLFDATAGVHRLAPPDRELLTHAARVHAVGEAIALRRQHEHGAYLVEHAELHGFTPSEAAQLTTLVRFHRSRGIDPAFPPFAAMDVEVQDRTRRLLALLQLADALDRGHDQAITTVSAERRNGVLALTPHGGTVALTAPELERRRDLVQRALGVEVAIVADTVVAATAAGSSLSAGSETGRG